MGFDRIGAKRTARERIGTSRPSPIFVTLLFLVLGWGVTALVNLTTGDPISEAMTYYYQWGYDLEEVIQYLLARSRGGLLLYGAASLVLWAFDSVLNFGYTGYCLGVARREEPGLATLFLGFSRFPRVLWAAILRGLVQTLWTLVCALPAALPFGVILYLSGGDLEAVLGLYWLFLLYLAVVTILISLRYRLTYYFLLDDPDCTAWEALRKSREAMAGWKVDLLVLDLSFLGWALLTALTMGLAALWFFPYMGITEALFYDAAVPRERDPQGGYAGDLYGSDTQTEDRGPF